MATRAAWLPTSPLKGAEAGQWLPGPLGHLPPVRRVGCPGEGLSRVEYHISALRETWEAQGVFSLGGVSKKGREKQLHPCTGLGCTLMTTRFTFRYCMRAGPVCFHPWCRSFLPSYIYLLV